MSEQLSSWAQYTIGLGASMFSPRKPLFAGKGLGLAPGVDRNWLRTYVTWII